MNALLVFALKTALLAAFSFGGLSAVLSQFKQIAVGSQLISISEFSQIYAMASASPGPNGPIFFALIGFTAFGLAGMVALLVAWASATLLVLHGITTILNRFQGHLVVRCFRVLKAEAVGLILAGAIAMIEGFNDGFGHSWAVQLALTVAGLVMLTRFRVNSLQVLIICSLCGAVLI